MRVRVILCLLAATVVVADEKPVTPTSLPKLNPKPPTANTINYAPAEVTPKPTRPSPVTPTAIPQPTEWKTFSNTVATVETAVTPQPPAVSLAPGSPAATNLWQQPPKPSPSTAPTPWGTKTTKDIWK